MYQNFLPALYVSITVQHKPQKLDLKLVKQVQSDVK